MRICVIPEGSPASPSNFVARLRLLEPLEVLSRRKPMTWACHPAGDPALPVNGPDIVIVQRACFPTLGLLHRSLRSLKQARQNGTRVVYELDDHIFCPALRSLILRSAVDEIDERSFARHQAHKALLEVADAVICSTPALAKAIRQLGVSVPIHVLPTSPDFHSPRWRYRPRKGAHSGFRIGWSGGSRVGRDLELLVPILPRILDRHPDVTFILAGSLKYSELFAGLPAERVRTVEWAPYDCYPALLAQYDLALIPSEDHAYNRCKSPLKAIDYNAMGIPVVCSAGSPCAEHVKRGIPGCGWVARTQREWISAIDRFLRRATAQPVAGKRLRTWTRRVCGYDAQAERHWRILSQIAGPGAA